MACNRNTMLVVEFQEEYSNRYLTTNYIFLLAWYLILAWEVGFTQAQVWALSWEVDFFQALALILTLVWEVGFYQALDLILALAWEVGFFYRVSQSELT